MKQVLSGNPMIRRSYASCVHEGTFDQSERFTMKFVRSICSTFPFSNAQLNQIFTTYNKFGSIDIEEAIKVHFEGALYYIYMAIGTTIVSFTCSIHFIV